MLRARSAKRAIHPRININVTFTELTVHPSPRASAALIIADLHDCPDLCGRDRFHASLSLVCPLFLFEQSRHGLARRATEKHANKLCSALRWATALDPWAYTRIADLPRDVARNPLLQAWRA
jgi:hypothetical protein